MASNKLIEDSEPGAVEIHRIDSDTGARQIAPLQEVRNRRDNERVTLLLDLLGKDAHDPSRNLMPVTIELLKARVAIGK